MLIRFYKEKIRARSVQNPLNDSSCEYHSSLLLMSILVFSISHRQRLQAVLQDKEAPK